MVLQASSMYLANDIYRQVFTQLLRGQSTTSRFVTLSSACMVELAYRRRDDAYSVYSPVIVV